MPTLTPTPVLLRPEGLLAWTELRTSDPAAALRFYTALFGWSAAASAGDEVTLRGGARAFADVVALRPELRARGVPPHWEGFVAVADVDARARRAQALGGSLLRPPVDVGGRGRMATVRDPGGAHLVLWQPAAPLQGALEGEPGPLAWFGLLARDPAAAVALYCDLLGLEARAPADARDGSIDGATLLVREGVAVASVVAMRGRPAAVPSHWIVYFAADDCDDVADRARRLGGAVVVPPTTIPGIGRIAALDDPQGGGFGVLARV